MSCQMTGLSSWIPQSRDVEISEVCGLPCSWDEDLLPLASQQKEVSADLPSDRIRWVWYHGLTGRQLGIVTEGAVKAPVPDDWTHVTFPSLYSPTHTLGSGAYGTCYSCTHKATGRTCAVKVVNKHGLAPEYLENMVGRSIANKLLMMTQVTGHPNIVRYLDFMIGQNNIYVAMDRYSGEELFDYLAENAPVSDRFISRSMSQLLSGLRHVHSHGIVHRDVKLENIRFTTKQASAVLVLLDFGLSTVLTTTPTVMDKCLEYGCPCISGPQDIVGTMMYTAPEVWSGWYDHRIDVWSIGVVLYIMLTGRIFFDVTTNPGPISRSDYRRAFRAREIQVAPKRLVDLLKFLLQMRPRARATSITALEHHAFHDDVGNGNIRPGSTFESEGFESCSTSIDVSRNAYLSVKAVSSWHGSRHLENYTLHPHQIDHEDYFTSSARMGTVQDMQAQRKGMRSSPWNMKLFQKGIPIGKESLLAQQARADSSRINIP